MPCTSPACWHVVAPRACCTGRLQLPPCAAPAVRCEALRGRCRAWLCCPTVCDWQAARTCSPTSCRAAAQPSWWRSSRAAASRATRAPRHAAVPPPCPRDRARSGQPATAPSSEPGVRALGYALRSAGVTAPSLLQVALSPTIRRGASSALARPLPSAPRGIEKEENTGVVFRTKRTKEL